MSEVKTTQQFLDEGLISRCGINCQFCPSYKDHVKSDADKQRCSDIWYRTLGFRVPPETIQPCPGCENSVYYTEGSPDGNGCIIRRCAISRNVQTCGHCSHYMADCTLHHGAGASGEGEPIVIETTTEDEAYFFGQLGRDLGSRSPEEYLAEIHESLTPDELVDGGSPLKRE